MLLFKLNMKMMISPHVAITDPIVCPRRGLLCINNDNLFSALPVEDTSDADDGDFTGDDSGSSSESSSLGSDGDIQEITNVEVSYFLCFS